MKRTIAATCADDFAMYNAGPAGNFNNAESQGYIRSVPQLVEQAKRALA